MQSRQKCEICGGSLAEEKFSARVLRLSQIKSIAVTDQEYGSALPMSKCSGCGFVQALAEISQGELTPLYADVSDREYLKTLETRSASNSRQLQAMLGTRISRIKSVLEIGAGGGAVLKRFKEQGMVVEGVEPNKHFCDFALREFGISLINDTFERIVLNRKFDLVVAIDVIEHVSSPKIFMQKIAAVIAPGGYLILGTPNRESAAARLFGKRWWQIRPGHLSYFSNGDVWRIGKNNHLDLVKQQSFYWTHSMGYLVNCFEQFVFGRVLLNASFLRVPVRLNLHDSSLSLFEKTQRSDVCVVDFDRTLLKVDSMMEIIKHEALFFDPRLFGYGVWLFFSKILISREKQVQIRKMFKFRLLGLLHKRDKSGVLAKYGSVLARSLNIELLSFLRQNYKRIIVVSASWEPLVKEILKQNNASDVDVYGTVMTEDYFAFNNLWNYAKERKIAEIGVLQFDLFTDSMDDGPLINKAANFCLLENNETWRKLN